MAMLSKRGFLCQLLCVTALLTSPTIHAQSVPEAARQYTSAHRSELTDEFGKFLSIPNVAADPAGLKRNADLLLEQLKARGVEAKLLTIPDAPAVVYGQIITPGAQHTNLLNLRPTAL